MTAKEVNWEKVYSSLEFLLTETSSLENQRLLLTLAALSAELMQAEGRDVHLVGRSWEP